MSGVGILLLICIVIIGGLVQWILILRTKNKEYRAVCIEALKAWDKATFQESFAKSYIERARLQLEIFKANRRTP